jgi:hypothetical protein
MQERWMERLCGGLLALFVTVTPAAGPAGADPADAATADFSGYSTGAVVHADALQAATEGPRLVDADVAFSGAAVASQGFATPIHNELAEAVLPTAQLGRKAYGRGTGLEAGTGTSIDYAPEGSPTPTAPVVRFLRPGSPPAEVTFEQLFGPKGFTTPANPFVSLALGEGPRAIAEPGRGADPNSVPDLAGDGTGAAGAVDVVRLTLPNPAPAAAPRALEVRLGHMEARAAVPAGGIRCRLPVHKATDPDVVPAGQTFTWTISIPPRADSLLGLACDLIGVSATDTSSAEPGVAYALETASAGGIISGKTVTWSNLGNYHPGDPPILVTISGRVSPISPAGVLTDTVDVTAALGHCTGGAVGKQLVGIAHVDTTAVTGAASLVGPRANVVAGACEAAAQLAPEAVAAAAATGTLPKTGDDQHHRGLFAVVLLGHALIAGQRRRHRRT